MSYGTCIKQRLELLRVKSLQPHSAGNSVEFSQTGKSRMYNLCDETYITGP